MSMHIMIIAIALKLKGVSQKSKEVTLKFAKPQK